MTGDSFYRYRSIENLLGKHKELESQEIYFASPTELNDPMEGFQDVFWEGDYILWKNLIKHYILSLSQAVAIVHIMGPEFRPDLVAPVLHLSASTLPTPMLKESHERICAAFFAEAGIEDCIRLVAKVRARVHREELAFYLSTLHAIALHNIMTHLRGSGMVKQTAGPPFPKDMIGRTAQNISDFLSAIERNKDNEREVISVLFESGGRALQQMALLSFYDKYGQVNDGWRFLAFEFTDFYCKNIPAILYPSWYAACFVGTPTHAAMWAHYGDRHEGVCLKFRAERDADGTPFLPLNGVVGLSHGPNGATEIKGEGKRPFYKVNYGSTFPQIDFFRSLGRFSIPVIHRDWYSDSGELSDMGYRLFVEESVWIENYWNNMKLITTTKFNDWRHEDEYRIVVHPLLGNEMERSRRIYKYDFVNLEAVIFGINTSMDHKLQIMKIVEQKCAESGRKEFEFFQANYSTGTSKFDVLPLRLIKLA